MTSFMTKTTPITSVFRGKHSKDLPSHCQNKNNRKTGEHYTNNTQILRQQQLQPTRNDCSE